MSSPQVRWRTSGESSDAFVESELATGVAAHPNLADAGIKAFGGIEGPTAVARGLPAGVAA